MLDNKKHIYFTKNKCVENGVLFIDIDFESI